MNKKQQPNTNSSLVLRTSNFVLSSSAGFTPSVDDGNAPDFSSVTPITKSSLYQRIYSIIFPHMRTKSLPSLTAGFTIVELIVVMSIFAILAGTVIFRYKDFGASIDLQNTTQEIALKIQQAQNDAIAGKYPALITSGGSTQSSPSTGWRPSYGVYFNNSAQYEKKLVYFFDRNDYSSGAPLFGDSQNPYRGALDTSSGGTDGTLDGSPSCGSGNSECLDLITIGTGERIADLCTYNNSNVCTSVSNLSIVFTRPFPDRVALASVNVQGNSTPVPGDVGIRIVSSTASIGGREIVVTPLGQIYIRTLPDTETIIYFPTQNNNQQ